ncbi:MAG: polyphosphate kinase 2 family protein [Ignavibacteriaceae bacterium]
MHIEKYLVKPGSSFSLNKFKTSQTGEIKSKDEARQLLRENILIMREYQAKLYAQDKFALLLVFQAMDAAGKDGTIKHVMSGLNPQGTQVFSFKQPSKEELDHGYLWRISKALPEKGRIGIFNRSHYEEVLIVRVHNLVRLQKIPDPFLNQDIWEQRYRQIREFEQYLFENGIITIKFFLHISKKEQKKRFLKRIEDPTKNWKFSMGDIIERKYWKDYQNCYQEAIRNTSTQYAPWYVIPADKKWFARLVVSEIIIKAMKSLNPSYPVLSPAQKKELEEAREMLLKENS